MRTVIGQSILLLYSFTTVLLTPADTALVVAFLAGVIFMSLNNIGLSETWREFSLIVFLGSACFFPKFLLFGPVVLYSILERRKYLPGIVLGVQCIYFYHGEPGIMALLAFGCAFAWIFQYQEEHYSKLEKMFRKTRDDSTELTILLREKNKSLLEKQDYEIYTATLRERNRIAREIHDNVGHMLSRGILMLGAMKAVNQDERMKEPLDHLEDTLNTAMTNVRESVHDLYDDSVNLKEVLQGIVAEYTFCPAELKFDMGYSVPREVKYSFITIVKEALNNISKHSNATKAEIVAREHPGMYQLIIEDNGNRDGMRKENEEFCETKGIGIRNMKDRIHALGGTIQFRREKGFRIYITVPKKEETA